MEEPILNWTVNTNSHSLSIYLAQEKQQTEDIARPLHHYQGTVIKTNDSLGGAQIYYLFHNIRYTVTIVSHLLPCVKSLLGVGMINNDSISMVELELKSTAWSALNSASAS